jgi:hypothetical protein
LRFYDVPEDALRLETWKTTYSLLDKALPRFYNTVRIMMMTPHDDDDDDSDDNRT